MVSFVNVLIIGATGFIGRALVFRLQKEGHQIFAAIRNPKKAQRLFQSQVRLVPLSKDFSLLEQAISSCDGIVNLAGEPIFGKPWNQKRKNQLISSRVHLTQRLAHLIQNSTPKPRVFISGSAIGIYGNRGDEILSEDSSLGQDFLAKLCKDWEQAALQASSATTRVVHLRTGVVLGFQGGMLSKLLPFFRLGLGGTFGSGNQYVSWIHVQDLVELIVKVLLGDRFQGPINGVAPHPIRNKEWVRLLGKFLHRPTPFSFPEFFLKIFFREAASVVLFSQRALPQKAEKLGFLFSFPTIKQALSEILLKAPLLSKNNRK